MNERQTVDQVLQKLNKGEGIGNEELKVLAAAIRDLKKETEVLKKQYRDFRSKAGNQAQPAPVAQAVAPAPKTKSWWAFWK